MRWRRGDGLPGEARAALDLLPRDRVLASGRTTDGRWFAATQLALVGAGTRVAWADVAHAQWFDEESVLVIDPVAAGSTPLRLVLAEPGRLPETVHERVMASIVVTRRVAVPGGGVRVAGRRDGTGDLVWQVLPDVGVDPDDPDVRRVVDVTVAALRGELGR